MKQENSQTIRKIKYATAGAGVAGAAVVILVWLAQMYNVDVPEGVQAAIVILLPALFTWVSGYFTEPATGDTVISK